MAGMRRSERRPLGRRALGVPASAARWYNRTALAGIFTRHPAAGTRTGLACRTGGGRRAADSIKEGLQFMIGRCGAVVEKGFTFFERFDAIITSRAEPRHLRERVHRRADAHPLRDAGNRGRLPSPERNWVHREREPRTTHVGARQRHGAGMRVALIALLAFCAVTTAHGRDPLTPVHVWAGPAALDFPWWYEGKGARLSFDAAYAQPSDWRATHVNAVVFTIKISVGNDVFYEQRGGVDTNFLYWLGRPSHEGLITSIPLSLKRTAQLRRLYETGAVVTIQFEEDELSRYGSAGRGAYDIVSNEPPDWCSMGCATPVPALPIGFIVLGALLLMAVVRRVHRRSGPDASDRP